MRAATATSWLLDNHVGFGDGRRDKVVVASGDKPGLVLAAATDGPLALNSADGSLGRTLLPRGMALDVRARLYLHDYRVICKDGKATAFLEPGSGRVMRFETGFDRGAKFDALPGVCASPPHYVTSAARRQALAQPPGIAVDDDMLFVADPGLTMPGNVPEDKKLGFSRQVRVYDLTLGRLVAIWDESVLNTGALGMGAEDMLSAGQSRVWCPVDVATGDGNVYVLDKFGRIFRARIGSPILCQIASPQNEAEFQQAECDEPEFNWDRIAVGRDGNIHVLANPKDCVPPQSRRPIVLVYHSDGCRLHSPDGKPVVFHDAAPLRVFFNSPPVIAHDDKRIFVSPSLAQPCPHLPEPPPNPLVPFGFRSETEMPLVFDSQGRPQPLPDATEPPRRFYQSRGVWNSEPLDSLISRCQWHRVAVQLPSLPPGTRVRFHSYSDEIERRRDSIGTMSDEQMKFCHEEVAPVQRGAGMPAGTETACEFLVQSGPGRFLWLRVELIGGGFATPRIESLRIHYPRQSYLHELPRVYRHDPEGEEFLDRFLSVFQTEWDDIDRRIENFAEFLVPCAIPAGPPIDPTRNVARLARWLGRTFDSMGSFPVQRKLLTGLADSDRSDRGGNRRGTASALKQSLHAYLQYISGRTTTELGQFPILVEGFTERRYLMTDGPSESRPDTPLWSREVVGRMQLGADRLNQSRLISRPHPQLDLFHEHAHRFRVVVPASWLPSADSRESFELAIEAEKPAHIKSELSLVEPVFCLGVQSTLGVDGFVGRTGPVVLSDAEQDLGPTLGVNTVLEPPAGTPSERTRSTTVLSGVNTILQPKIGPLQ